MEEHKAAGQDQSECIQNQFVSQDSYNDEERKIEDPSSSSPHEQSSRSPENHISNSSDSEPKSREGSNSSSQNPPQSSSPHDNSKQVEREENDEEQVRSQEREDNIKKNEDASEKADMKQDRNKSDQDYEDIKEYQEYPERQESSSDSPPIHRQDRDDQIALNQIQQRINSSKKSQNSNEIKQLNMSDIQVSILSFQFKYAIQQIKSLEILSLSNCKLTSFEFLPQLPNLIGLDVANNMINDDAEFEILPRFYPLLQVFLAENNGIRKLSTLKKISENKNLFELDLQGNPVTEEQGYEMFIEASFLEIIFLDNHLLNERRNNLAFETVEKEFEDGRKIRKVQNGSQQIETVRQFEKDQLPLKISEVIQASRKFIRSDTKDMSIGKRRRPKVRMNNFLCRNYEMHTETRGEKRQFEENSKKQNEETLKRLIEGKKKIVVQQMNNCLISEPEKKATENCIEERSVEQIKSSEKYLESESEQNQKQDSEFQEFEIKRAVRQRYRKQEKKMKRFKKNQKITKLRGMTNSQLKAELRKSLKVIRE